MGSEAFSNQPPASLNRTQNRALLEPGAWLALRVQKKGPLRGSPHTPLLTGNGGKQAPRSCPRRTATDERGRKTGCLPGHPHTLVDGLGGRSGPGPAQRVLSLTYTFRFRLVSKLVPLLALPKVSGEQEPVHFVMVGSSSLTPRVPGTFTNSEWGSLGKAGCC